MLDGITRLLETFIAGYPAWVYSVHQDVQKSPIEINRENIYNRLNLATSGGPLLSARTSAGTVTIE